jgi:hypothetical protein
MFERIRYNWNMSQAVSKFHKLGKTDDLQKTYKLKKSLEKNLDKSCQLAIYLYPLFQHDDKVEHIRKCIDDMKEMADIHVSFKEGKLSNEDYASKIESFKL